MRGRWKALKTASNAQRSVYTIGADAGIGPELGLDRLGLGRGAGQARDGPELERARQPAQRQLGGGRRAAAEHLAGRLLDRRRVEVVVGVGHHQRLAGRGRRGGLGQVAAADDVVDRVVLDRGAILLQRQRGPGDQPERRVGAEDPAFRVTDVRQQRPEHAVGQRLQGRAQRGLERRLAALAESREVGLDGAADGGDVRLDHVGRTQVDQPDLAPARGRDNPRGIARRGPLLLGPLGLEVEDTEPRDLDQDGVGGQRPADLLGRDPRVIARGPASVLTQLLG